MPLFVGGLASALPLATAGWRPPLVPLIDSTYLLIGDFDLDAESLPRVLI
jgi:hypothetical protein